jgi:hypothetical protein
VISSGQVSRAGGATGSSPAAVGQARSDLQAKPACRAASRTLPRERRCDSNLGGGSCGSSSSGSSCGAGRHFFGRQADFVVKASSQEQLIGSSCSTSSGGGGSSAVGGHEDLELRAGGGGCGPANSIAETFAEPMCRPKLSTFCQGDTSLAQARQPPATPVAAAVPTASRAHVTLSARGSERFLLPAESV